MIAVCSLIREIFSDNLNVDNREAITSFEVPDSLGPFGGTYGLLIPQWKYLIQFAAVVALQGLFFAAMACTVYSILVRRRGSIPGYIMSFLILIPGCILFPYWAIITFQIGNKCLRFNLGASAFFCMMKIVEATFGLSPTGTEASFINYFMYFSCPLDILFDDKTSRPIKATREETVSNIKNTVISSFKALVLVNILYNFDYQPFRPTLTGNDENVNFLWYFLDVGHIKNCFVIALTLQSLLELAGYSFAATVNILLGCKTITMMKNPLMSSKSPSDFWGRRWNLAIHSLLKRGVYLPLRQLSFPRFAASMAAFAMSGLLHEFLISVSHLILDSERDENGVCVSSESCHITTHGENAKFFLWNGLVIAIEVAIGRTWVIQYLSKTLPKQIRPFLIVLPSLPVAHWLLDEYFQSNYRDSFQIAMPILVKLS